MKVESFYDLEVYQLAFEVQQEIFELSKHFPKGEAYSLTDQIRRSSRSVGANIAEAWRKRRYPAHFASKLTDSDGENAETQHWLRTAEACEYLNTSSVSALLEKTNTIGAKLGRMISSPEKWQPK
jgi:four helix bundle protein